MVDVYILNTSCFADKKLYDAVYKSLSETRRKKIDSYVYDKDKFLSMGAGYLLERGIRGYDVPQQVGHMTYGRNGKPKLISKERAYNFNLSHSGEYAVCAFSTGEVGVDVERIGRDVTEKMLSVGCTPKEYKHLSSLSEEEQTARFYWLWTIKESYMKLLGTGLTLLPHQIEVSAKFPIILKVEGEKQPVFFKEYVLPGYCLTVCSYENEFAENYKVVKI